MPSIFTVSCTLPESVFSVGIFTSNTAIPSSPVVTCEVLLVTPNLSLSAIDKFTSFAATPPLSLFNACTAIKTLELSLAISIGFALASCKLRFKLSTTVLVSVVEPFPPVLLLLLLF